MFHTLFLTLNAHRGISHPSSLTVNSCKYSLSKIEPGSRLEVSGFLFTIEKFKEFMNILTNWKYLKLFDWQQVKVAGVSHTPGGHC